MNESILCPAGVESFSSGRPPFIVQGGRVHRCWIPTDGPNKEIFFTKIGTIGATVMENLLPDTLHRPVDSLTEGVFLLSIGEAPVEAV